MGRKRRAGRSGLKHWKVLVSAVRLMNFAATNIRLYPPTHSEVTGVMARLREVLAPVFLEHEDLGFGYMDEILFIEGAMTIEETQNNEDLVTTFKKCRVKYLTLSKDVTEADFLKLFSSMNDIAQQAQWEPLADRLSNAGISSIRVVESDAEDEASKGAKGRKRTLLDWYDKVIGILGEAHEGLRAGKADLKAVYHVADDMMATIRTKGFQPFLLLPSLGRDRDPHIAHAVNVAVTCGALADLGGLNAGQAQTLCVAALLHDLGRCLIPSEWAKDPSPLTLFERAVVNQHATWSFLLLAREKSVPAPIALLAGHHHMPVQGKSGPGGYQPDILHKLLQAADAYELGLFSDQFYWKRQPRHRYLPFMLKRRGADFDSTAVKLLTQAVGLFPVGTLVELDDGRRGIVVRAEPANALRPKIFMYEENPAAVPEGGDEPPPEIVDLMDLNPAKTGFARSIKSAPGVLGAEVAARLDGRREHLLSHTL